jgi:hypothetical protein
VPCPVGTKCSPHNYTRDLSATPAAVAKRRQRGNRDPDELRAQNRRHQRAKRARDRAT